MGLVWLSQLLDPPLTISPCCSGRKFVFLVILQVATLRGVPGPYMGATIILRLLRVNRERFPQSQWYKPRGSRLFSAPTNPTAGLFAQNFGDS